MSRRQPDGSGFTLIELLIVIGIVGTLVVLLLPAVNAAREASRRTSCINNQRQIGIAVGNFESTRGFFPPGQYRRISGGDRWSWSTQILPYLEESVIFARIDHFQSIVSEWNKGTPDHPGPVTQPIATFLCPSAGSFHATRDEGRLGNLEVDQSGLASIDYLAISGPFHDALDLNGRPYGYNRGIFAVLKSDDKAENAEETWMRPRPLIHDKLIRDGRSKTLMLTECTGRGWAKGMKAALHDGRNVGSVGKDFFKDEADNELTLSSAINTPSAIAWRNEEPFSDHPGGVNGLMADGSVGFLNDAMERSLLRSLASRDGDEPLTVKMLD